MKAFRCRGHKCISLNAKFCLRHDYNVPSSPPSCAVALQPTTVTPVRFDSKHCGGLFAGRVAVERLHDDRCADGEQ